MQAVRTDARAEVLLLPQQGIECLSRRMINRGALLAVCDIRINGWHLLLRDCKWFRKDNRSWIGLPSTSYKGHDGVTRYTNVVAFVSKEAHLRFQAAALEAVEQFVDGD